MKDQETLFVSPEGKGAQRRRAGTSSPAVTRPINGKMGYFCGISNRGAIHRTARLQRACCLESLESRLYLAASYTWQNINIGAGGFVDGIFYDPHNQNVIYARSDVGGLYKTVNDGTTWTQLLNWIGNGSGGSNGVLSFAIDPENSNNLYADTGLYQGTNGYVLYSTNAGATWGVTPLSFYVGGNMDGRGAGERIAVDPYDSNIIFLGSNDSGLWESTNAGHSFSQVTSFSTSASINFVLFDPNGGTTGKPTQEIFVGENSTAFGTNLFETTSGGTSFTEVTGSGSAPTGWMPNRAAMASDGNLYLAYANDQAPTEPSNGGVFRYNTSTGVWANISPVVPQAAAYDYFGYCGLALDPNSPTTLVVASLDRYNYGEQIWRTTDANASSPTWTALYDTASYTGYAPTRNTTAAPYMASSSDNIGNWACTVAIDPFNSAQIMHGYGGGIWATNDGTSTTTLTAPNSWYFPDTGIVMTAVLGINASTGGIPLYGAMGDVGGFAFTTLTFSPTQGNVFFNGGGGNLTSVDSAGLDPQDAVMAGNLGTVYGFYTTNGVTFSQFAANPGGSSGYSNGTVAISANGSTIVWAPSGQAAYYSTSNGSSWTLATLVGGSALPTGGTILSDKVNPNYFYYWTENSSDNSWTLYISSNGGHTFAASAGGALGTGNPTVVVNPTVAGQLWLGTYVGIYESTNFGASFSHPYSYSTNVSSLAVGAAAPGSSYPAIYIYGTPVGDSFEGIYRSDDGGNTWLLLNNSSQQWGGVMAADPNVFGRVYVANEIGNPATSLPAGWSDSDINEPGNPGWATSSSTLSNGTTVNQWNLVGGGAGFSSTPIQISSLSRTGGVATAITTTASGVQVGQMITISGATNSAYDGTFVITGLYNTTTGLSNDVGAATEFTFAIAGGTDTASGAITATLGDQFNFAYQPITGSAAISAQIHSITNADESSGTPQAGVMYRASTNPNDPFFAVAQTSAGSLVLEYRTTTGGGITTQTITGIPVGSEYVEIVRNGSNFTGFYSSSGTSWTQIGSSISITAMPATANAGLMATASYNPQLTDAIFSNVVINTGPSVANAAAVNPNPVTGTSTVLSALGSENGSGSGLTYTWSYTGPTGVTYIGNANGTNAAQNITANFTQAGSYNFTATITDSSGLFTTTSVNVTVQQTAANIVVSPSSAPVVPVGLTQQFLATATDQFGNSISSPSFTWGITGGGNSIDNTGDATLGSTPGSFTVTASIGSAQGMANVIAENFAVPAGSTLDINLGAAGPVAVTATGGNITASQNGLQITLSGFSGVTVTDTASNDILNFNGPLALPFTFINCGSSALNVNSGTLNFANAAAVITLGTLNIVAGATVDVVNNTLILNYAGGTDPIGVIAGYLQSGYNSGTWNGAGIDSSTAAANPGYALGYADWADPGNPANLATHQIEIKYTLLGDADLDGSVTGDDFTILVGNLGKSGKTWDTGNFLYSATGAVTGDDFTALVANLGKTAQGSDVELPASNSTLLNTTAPTSTVLNSAATTPAPFVVSATPTVATVTGKSTTAAPAARKSNLVSVSRAVVTDTTSRKTKAFALAPYAASAVTIPTAGSTAAPQNTNKDAKFLADR
jgi:hypothetical protein